MAFISTFCQEVFDLMLLKMDFEIFMLIRKLKFIGS